MKRIIFLAMSLCFLAVSASAATPEETLKLLILGNQKYVLENALNDGVVATVLADSALSTSPATLFGLPESRLKIVRTGDGLPAEGITPVIIVLGEDEAKVWSAYAGVLKKSPALVQAVLKGQTSVLGATLNAEDGSVNILGPHPDLLVMAGQYILGKPVQESASENAETAPEESGKEESSKVEQEPVQKIEKEAGLEEKETSAARSAPASEEVQASSGGSGFLGALLSVAAIIGIVIVLDKTVLKS